MKSEISFLAIIAFALCANCADASECVGSDCELEPIVVEQNIAPMDFAEVNEEYDYCEECEYDMASTDTCYDYSCPFDTDTECEVWHKKPEHNEYSGPRAPHLSLVQIDEILYAIYGNYDINADNENMSPLVDRYKMLVHASDACCGAGIMYKMRENGASDKDIYRFLQNDANFFAIIKRCIMMNNNDIAGTYSHGVTGQMVADVRNACLCKNRQWFENLLQPFSDIYERMPIFRDKHFVYSYSDDMKRDITVYINDDVQTVSGLLNECPK